jgi:uncharacterized protein DUF4350
MEIRLRTAFGCAAMTGVSRRVVFLTAAAAALLLGVNLWLWPNYSLQTSPTSFGVNDNGYKAAFLLLSEIGLPVSRSYVTPEKIPAHSTVWFVAPSFLEPDGPAGDENAKAVVQWVRAGATAVVFGNARSEWKRLGVARTTSPSGDTATISGEWARLPRTIKVAGLLSFAKGDDHARVRLSSGKEAFAIELQVGAGRLVAIADDRFFRNANLAESDGSVLLVDLARALGPPVFDERCHGLAAPVSIFAAIGYSRAMLPLLIGLVAALLWAGEQRSWPMRTLPASAEGIAPSIVSFVESLGTLYSRARDPQAAFNAYRAGFLHRLRRQISPHAELPERLLIERIARDRSLADETRGGLTGDTLPASESELVRAVRAIESYPRVGS